MTDQLPTAEPWQLSYFSEAIARGLCFAEAGGCAGLIDFDQDQLEALARRDDVRLRVIHALRQRIGAVGSAEAERAMLRAEAWIGFVACRARKDERSALSWLKYFAELGGVTASAPSKDDASRMSDDELRQEILRRQDRLKLVGGGGQTSG